MRAPSDSSGAHALMVEKDWGAHPSSGVVPGATSGTIAGPRDGEWKHAAIFVQMTRRILMQLMCVLRRSRRDN